MNREQGTTLGMLVACIALLVMILIFVSSCAHTHPQRIAIRKEVSVGDISIASIAKFHKPGSVFRLNGRLAAYHVGKGATRSESRNACIANANERLKSYKASGVLENLAEYVGINLISEPVFLHTSKKKTGFQTGCILTTR